MKISKLKKNYKRVMGVDCSSHSLAFSIFDDGELVTWGEVDFAGKTLLERIGYANRMINTLYHTVDFFNVDKIVYESATYVNNRKTVIDLSYSFGAAIAPLIRPGVSVETVPPITWQLYINNKALTKAEKAELAEMYPGKSKSWLQAEARQIRKERTIDWVEGAFDIVVESDNVADAIGIGYYGVSHG